MFTNLEQAERMVNKYRALEIKSLERDDIDQAEKYAELADQLEEAIRNYHYKQTTRQDRMVISKAVSIRNQLDAELAHKIK